MTGQYDRKAEGQALTDANTARIARDPFANMPEAPQYPDVMTEADRNHAHTCRNCVWLPGGTVALCDEAPGKAPAADEDQTPAAVERADAAAVRAEAPAVCGADTQTGQCQRKPHAPEYPHVSGKYAAAADADMPNPNPGVVSLFRADWPYPVLAAAEFAALYHQAAETIKARGYFPHEVSGYADEPGISITGALKLAAAGHVTVADPDATPDQIEITAVNLTEELETRLSGVLYVLGQIHSRTPVRDMSDIHVGWALGHYELGPNPSLAAAVSLLEQAARMFAALENVTEADDPGRM